MLHADDSTAVSSTDTISWELSGGFLVSGDAGIEGPSRDTGERLSSPSSSLSFYLNVRKSIHLCEVKGGGRLAFRRSIRNLLKRFHRPAIPATSEITLSISRGFTSSSETGRRPAVGEGTVDGKLAFATSASYSCSTPTLYKSRCCLYLMLHGAFFLPPVDQPFADAIALL